jgi:hypothetical protein
MHQRVQMIWQTPRPCSTTNAWGLALSAVAGSSKLSTMRFADSAMPLHSTAQLPSDACPPRRRCKITSRSFPQVRALLPLL